MSAQMPLTKAAAIIAADPELFVFDQLQQLGANSHGRHSGSVIMIIHPPPAPGLEPPSTLGDGQEETSRLTMCRPN